MSNKDTCIFLLTIKGSLAVRVNHPRKATTPLANSIVVQPDDPYIEPSNDHYKSIKPKVNFKLVVLDLMVILL